MRLSEYEPTKRQLAKIPEVEFKATGRAGSFLWGITTKGHIASIDLEPDEGWPDYWCSCPDSYNRKRPCIHVLKLEKENKEMKKKWKKEQKVKE